MRLPMIAPVSCVYRTDCIENDIVLVSVVWPAIAILWEGMGEFVNSLGIDKFNMVIYGYATMFLLHTLIKEVDV